MFKQYHYLSSKLPTGKSYTFGLFLDDRQIAFAHFAELTPYKDKKRRRILHSTRTVVHPDYCGLGLGSKFTSAAAEFVYKKGFRVMSKFSNPALFFSRSRDPNWRLLKTSIFTAPPSGRSTITRKSGYRNGVKTFIFEYSPHG